MQCARHPHVETFLRCSRCNKPICPDCVVFGPAGALCRECADLRGSPLYRVPLGRFGLALVVGVAAGAAAGFLSTLAAEAGMFVQLWVAVLTGSAVGEAILRAIQRKRGPTVEAIAAIGAAAGAACGVLLRGLQIAAAFSVPLAAVMPLRSVWSLASIVIIAASAWGRTRL